MSDFPIMFHIYIYEIVTSLIKRIRLISFRDVVKSSENMRNLWNEKNESIWMCIYVSVFKWKWFKPLERAILSLLHVRKKYIDIYCIICKQDTIYLYDTSCVDLNLIGILHKIIPQGYTAKILPRRVSNFHFDK